MMRMIPCNRQGLTLVELMIVLVLSTLLMSAAYISYTAQHKGGRLQEQVASMQQDIRAAVQIMERDIRNAGCDPTFADIPPLLADTSGGNVLGLAWDSAGAGTAQHIRYDLSSGNLRRNSAILIQNVTSFGVVYWNSGGGVITPESGGKLSSSQVEDVRSVRVTLQVKSNKVDPDSGEFVYRTFSRLIKLRNVP